MPNGRNLLIAFFCATSAAILIFWYVKGVEERLSFRRQVVNVLVAREGIPARFPLSRENLALRKIPKELVVEGALSDFNLIRGRVAGMTLEAGEQLTNGKLLEIGTKSGLAVVVPKGLRAITVAIDDTNGMAGLVQPGDSVDLLAVFSGTGEQSEKVVTFLQKILVLAVSRQVQNGVGPLADSITGEDGAPGGESPAEQPESPNALMESPATLTVAVTPEQAQQIALAEEVGKIRITLRSLSDQGQAVLNEMSVREAFGRQPNPPPARSPNRPVNKDRQDTAEILRGVSKEVVRFKGFPGTPKGGVATVETESSETK